MAIDTFISDNEDCKDAHIVCKECGICIVSYYNISNNLL